LSKLVLNAPSLGHEVEAKALAVLLHDAIRSLCIAGIEEELTGEFRVVGVRRHFVAAEREDGDYKGVSGDHVATESLVDGGAIDPVGEGLTYVEVGEQFVVKVEGDVAESKRLGTDHTEAFDVLQRRRHRER